ncbi:MAG: hypothetical protein NDJ75_06395 [Thermoanaerobaculia bacterium]|nr:hypothetical protein [Thermoanaerobaculia bacterium]
MASEYDPVFRSRADADDPASDLAQARRLFAAASRPYLGSPIPWLVWALVLPAAALATPAAFGAASYAGVLGLWSTAILTAGAVEGLVLLRTRRRLGGSSPLGSWAMTLQGNLSLVAVALSALLLALDAARFLPALWLLLLGHSLFALGGLAFPPQRAAGIVYQMGGVAALVPGVPPLVAFAVATAVGNLWIAAGVARRKAPEVGQLAGGGASS